MSYYRSRGYGGFHLFPSDTPVTNFILISNGITFILLLLRIFPLSILSLLIGTTSSVIREPWTLLTYPLISLSGGPWAFLNLLFSLYWLYFLGGMLERSWGNQRFLFMFFGLSGISAVFLALGGILTGINLLIGDLWLPLTALTVVWASRDPHSPVMFFLFPMELRWLAVIVCAFLFVNYATYSPIIGVTSLGGSLAAYFLGGGASSSTGMRGPRNFQGKNPLEWYKKWQFKRKFRRFWGD